MSQRRPNTWTQSNQDASVQSGDGRQRVQSLFDTAENPGITERISSEQRSRQPGSARRGADTDTMRIRVLKQDPAGQKEAAQQNVSREQRVPTREEITARAQRILGSRENENRSSAGNQELFSSSIQQEQKETVLQRSRTESSGAQRSTPQRSRAENSGAQRNTSAGSRSSREGQTGRASQQTRRSSQNGSARRAVQGRDASARRSASVSGRRRKAAASGKERKNKVFTKSFKIGFFISWGVFLLALIITMIVLWNFLNRYEKGLPEHYMDQILTEMKEGNLQSVHLVTSDGTPFTPETTFADESVVSDILIEKNAADPLRYAKVSSESGTDSNVYMIRSADDNLLKVTLVKDADSGNENLGWHETETKIVTEELAPSTITAQIPSANTLEVNGITADPAFITEKGSRVQILSNLIDRGIIGEQPTVDTYTVTGILRSPEVVMVDGNGTRTPCTVAGSTYLAGFEADEAFAASARERVLGMIEPYAMYFSGDAPQSVLRSIMLDNSPAYENAVAADVSWMQAHDGVEITEKSVDNIRKYSDECFSCDVRFKVDILQNGVSVRTWDTNMTWILVKDGDYYVADFVTKTADE